MIKMHKLCLNLSKKLLEMPKFTNLSEFYQSLLTKIQKIESNTTDFCFFFVKLLELPKITSFNRNF